MFNVEDCIALLTNNGSKTICEAMNRQFLENEITRLQWTALYFIRKSNRITQKDLANILMISYPSATNLVHRLIRAGFVTQEDDPDDFRAKLLRITAKGEKTYHDAYPIVERFNSSTTAQIYWLKNRRGGAWRDKPEPDETATFEDCLAAITGDEF